MTDHSTFASLRARSGFTLPELLLASVLGAMLLSALAVTTFGFTRTLDYMEDEAGVGNDADPVLRRITKEIRESWWVEQPTSTKIEVADANGELTEYFIEDGGLWVKRPNGDTGMIYTDFVDFTIDNQMMERKREGPQVTTDGVFYQATASGTAGTIFADGDAGESLALAFTAPGMPSEVPGVAAMDEELTSVDAAVFDIPLTYKQISGSNYVTFSIHESWGHGKAKPYGSAIASVTVGGGSLPPASTSGGSWVVPSSNVAISLSEPLEVGTGYTLVITPLGQNIVVLQKFNVSASVDVDEVAKHNGSAWAPQAVTVPFAVRGPWTRTSTITHNVVTMVTLTAYPTNRPLQQRSAAILSQALTMDPWLGVVPGEIAP
jgi:prepilin-type N-terminal cleavage/methylation domain-containing protein